MPAGHGAPQRRHTTSLSIGHAHPLGSLPNMPPAAASGYVPRRLYDDIATGLLHDPARAEITRLSAKTLELTAKLQAGDAERRHLDGLLDSARRECANVQAKLAQLQRNHLSLLPTRDAPPAPGRAEASHPAASQVFPRVDRSAMGSRAHPTSPRDETGAAPEGSSARELLGGTRGGPSARAANPQSGTASPTPANATRVCGPRGGAASPPPGIVARLQADLQEAAEERRIARQQAHALRERVRELERLLACSGGAPRVEAPPPVSTSEDAALLQASEGRAADAERRLQISLGRQREQAHQLAWLLHQRRHEVAEEIAPAEITAAAAAAAQLRALQSALNAERTGAARLVKQVQLSEEAQRAAREGLRVAKEEATRAAAAARSERIDNCAQQRDALAVAHEQARAAAAQAAAAQAEAAQARAATAAETALRGSAETRLVAAVAEASGLRERMAERQAETEREAVRLAAQQSQQQQQAEGEADRLRAELRDSRSEVGAVRAELSARAGEAAAMQLELGRMRALLEAPQPGAEERKEQEALLIREREELACEREQLSRESEALAAEAAELQRQLVRQRGEAEEALAALRRQLGQVQGQVETLRAEAGRAASEERRLAGECAQLREGAASIEGLREACGRASAQVVALTGQAQGERARADALGEKLASLETSAAACAKQKQSLQRQVEQLEQPVARGAGVAKQLDRMERELAEARAARAEAEEKLGGAQAMVNRQRTQVQATADELRRETERRDAVSEAARAPVDRAADGRGSGEDTGKLADALAQLSAARAELSQKEERWRLSSLKRHAEHSKLEATLKMAQESGERMKKKADYLELALLSHQKAMDKDKARMVQDQLKERNDAFDQQLSRRDVHAAAAQRVTFDQTFECQMSALESKLRRLDR